MTRIEGDIRTCISSYLHAIDIPPGGRAGLGSDSRWDVPCGFAPHGIRGAFNIIDNQVAIVARLETFMCTDPPRRDSRLRFLVFSQDSRDALHDLHVRQRHARTLLFSPPAMTLTWTLTPSPSRVYYRALGPSRSWFSSRNAQSPPVTPPSSSSLSMINVAFLDAPEYMQI